MAIKSYKGMDKNMQCRGFQYKKGETYETDKADVCNSGFHACESPMEVFSYYPPSGSRFFEVEQDGILSRDKGSSKVASTILRVGAEIGIPGIVRAHVECVKENIEKNYVESNTGDCSAATNTGYQSAATNTGNCSAATNTGSRSAATNTGNCSAATNTGDCSAATNTGNCSAATNTGYQSAATNTGNCSAATNTGSRSAATNTGNCSAATNTGDCSAATNTGNCSAATNTGNCSAATNTGDWSAATNTGNCSAATNTGYQSAATNTGDWSAAEVKGRDSVAIATGYESKAKGAIGCAIVIAERGEWNGETYPLIAIKAAIVDGENIKGGVWYTLKNGEFVEVNDKGESEDA